MDEASQQKAVGSVRLWEIVVAGIFLAFGALVVFDSRRLGASWSSDGPQAGYFPFYIGLIICISAIVNLVGALRRKGEGAKSFVTREQLRMVLVVMIPYAFYVGLTYPLGMYEASVIFIAVFMRFLGKYSWLKIAVVSIATMVAFFLMFEVWFSVPLPKGPIEAMLGFQ